MGALVSCVTEFAVAFKMHSTDLVVSALLFPMIPDTSHCAVPEERLERERRALRPLSSLRPPLR